MSGLLILCTFIWLHGSTTCTDMHDVFLLWLLLEQLLSCCTSAYKWPIRFCTYNGTYYCLMLELTSFYLKTTYFLWTYLFARSPALTWILTLNRAGGTQRLPRLVGKSVAKELIFTGRKIGGREAMSIGMFTRKLLGTHAQKHTTLHIY